MKKLLLSVSAAFMLFAVTAQPPQKGQQNGREKMQQFKKMAFHKLNLTDEQKVTVKNLNDDFQKRMQELNKKENITVKEQRDQREALLKAHKKNIDNVLTAEQKKQLADSKQKAETRMAQMADKRMQHAKTNLKLSDEQFTKFKAIQDEFQNKSKAIRSNEKLSREERKAQMEAIMQDRKSKTEALLADEQKTEWKKLNKHPQHKGNKQSK